MTLRSISKQAVITFLSVLTGLGFLHLNVRASPLDPEKYEQALLTATRLISTGAWENALSTLNALTDEFPQSRVSHLLKADVFAALAGTGEKISKLKSLEIESLRQQIKLRWRNHQEFSDKNQGLVPDKLIKVSAQQSLILYVDLPAARLYIFRNNGQGLVSEADYYVTIGKKGFGKEREGDLKTPVGIYSISGYKPGSTLHERYGHGALTLDYPNPLDQQLERTGYGIWIHGTEPGWINRGPFASDGCITLSNNDFKDLVTRFDLQSGTRVVIDDQPIWKPVKWIEATGDSLVSELSFNHQITASPAKEESVANSVHDEKSVDHGLTEILLYPGSGAELVTQRLLLSDMQRKTTITEYWTRNDDDIWKLTHRME
ncbi:MAG: L,D-transpeptidase [Proteobacteria bacterium]|nr:L,D-transpeptidase [Pseudomonadota bacterium]MBT4356791.1 L,D-transpeptidase [Pseudomonadota bacterium]MBT5188854.1 L,D-transpeptidase [Pseudomonadota bacterium]MBT6066080.1 L,D-transpeptidase [Pseudomonadota bacterium]MBT7813741.1 L,D-transpeptidase [Pseudomonadota bacterium]